MVLGRFFLFVFCLFVWVFFCCFFCLFVEFIYLISLILSFHSDFLSLREKQGWKELHILMH